MTPLKKPKILIVAAIPMTIKMFLLGYVSVLAERYDVTVVCSGEGSDSLTKLLPRVRFKVIDIKRRIDLRSDMNALKCLVGFMRSENFDMIHSVTPKAGLLAQLAGWLCGVRTRLHTFTGQVWVTQKGFKRKLLKWCDLIVAACATNLLADSVSQKEFLICERIVNPKKIGVIGAGSISGVDLARFRPDPNVREALRKQLGVSDTDVVALYLGRLTRDKGVLDLAEAFSQVCNRQPNLKLIFVGPDEEGLATEIEKKVTCNEALAVIGPTACPEDFMVAADFFCLPSYREGFGSVVIEAAACGLPSIASAIYGLTDAIEDGFSGVLHLPGDVNSIADLLMKLSNSKDWREKLGRQARQRAVDKFSADVITQAQVQYVQMLLELSKHA